MMNYYSIILFILLLVSSVTNGQKEPSFSWVPIIQNSKKDSIETLLKSPLAKKMSIKLIRQSFEWEKPIFNENRLPFDLCSYIVIPTLKMDSLQLIMDSLNMPIEIMVYLAGNYVGFYKNNCKEDQLNWGGVSKSNCGYFMRDNKLNRNRYNGVGQHDIGKKIKSLRAEFIFSIKSIYHHYFYYKKNQLFVIELNTLNTYTIQEYYDKYVKQKKN